MASHSDSDPHGWRIAGMIVALALALTAGAWTIHKKIYCDPTHPSCAARASAETHAAADHGADTSHMDHSDGTGGAPTAQPGDSAGQGKTPGDSVSHGAHGTSGG